MWLLLLYCCLLPEPFCRLHNDGIEMDLAVRRGFRAVRLHAAAVIAVIAAASTMLLRLLLLHMLRVVLLRLQLVVVLKLLVVLLLLISVHSRQAVHHSHIV